MSKIRQYDNISNITELQQLTTFVSRAIQDIVQTANGKLDFQNNFACVLVSATFTQSGVESTVPHTLGRVPTGRLIYAQTSNSVIYDTGTAWTAQNLYLATQGTGYAKLIVF